MKKLLMVLLFTLAIVVDMNANARAATQTDYEVTVDEEELAVNWQYVGTYRTTGYCNCKRCCGRWSGGPTASGVMPTANHTVATGSEFPFGTKLWINGTVYTVEDRGVKNGCIDIYYGDHSTAYSHGVQYHGVYVMR